ncbi:hypothetical protein IFVP69_C2100250 [Vibrio parahaemolyticus]
MLFWRQSKEHLFEGKIGSQERAIDNIYTSDPNSDVDLLNAHNFNQMRLQICDL